MPVGCLEMVRKAVRLHEYAMERMRVYRSKKATMMREAGWTGSDGWGRCRWRVKVKSRADESELRSFDALSSSQLRRKNRGKNWYYIIIYKTLTNVVTSPLLADFLLLFESLQCCSCIILQVYFKLNWNARKVYFSSFKIKEGIFFRLQGNVVHRNSMLFPRLLSWHPSTLYSP